MMVNVTSFQQKVYDMLCSVPKGNITTYGALAKALGIKSPRSIGQALKKNLFSPCVPCHRVVSSDGSIGGFFGTIAGPAIQRKIRLLQAEGISVRDNKVVDFRNITHSFCARSFRASRNY